MNTITNLTIPTHGVGQAAAIANIKNNLVLNKAVQLTYYLPTQSDWDSFFDFWSSQPETDIWNPDFSCGHTWEPRDGAGHAVVVVGYDTSDPDPGNHYWKVLNSWGTAGGGRPNGLFRLYVGLFI